MLHCHKIVLIWEESLEKNIFLSVFVALITSVIQKKKSSRQIDIVAKLAKKKEKKKTSNISRYFKISSSLSSLTDVQSMWSKNNNFLYRKIQPVSRKSFAQLIVYRVNQMFERNSRNVLYSAAHFKTTYRYSVYVLCV